MNKTLKVLLYVALVVLMLVLLAGCGNKLVATKEVTEGDEKITEKYEISFKKDKVSKVKMSREYSSEDSAKKVEEEYNEMKKYVDDNPEMADYLPTKFKRSGKKVTIEYSAKAFANLVGSDKVDEMTKENIKKELEDGGYKVK